MTVQFSESALEQFSHVLKKYPNKEAALLPLLHLAKKEFKVISLEVMEYLAKLLDISPVKVMEVVSFYTLFPRNEEGKFVIQVCATLSCSLMGANSVLNYLQEKLGISVGETTPDKFFTIKKVECLGSCGTAPVIQINDDYYENLTRSKLDKILSDLKKNS